MIKIGIIGAVSSDWMGGFNYFRNLIISLDTLKNKELEIYQNKKYVQRICNCD
jgi:hypothetical protein